MKTVLHCGAALLAACLSIAPARGVGVLFNDPTGGWLYAYDGVAAAFGGAGTTNSLDGSWVSGGSSDSWDGSHLGGVFDTTTNDPGGLESQTAGGDTYLRIQDPGDPRNQSAALGYTVVDPSNRKVYLFHPLALPGNALDTGLTLAFRIRIATTGLLDAQYPSTVANAGENNTVPGGTAWVPNGGLNADDGKGFIGLHGATGGSISFSPATPVDHFNDGSLFGASALSMNNLNGSVLSQQVDPWSREAGTTNALAVSDWTGWHEFWITISADTTGGGTHHVNLYADGALTPVSFDVTAGTGQEGGASTTQNYLAMGFENSAQMGAADVDYVAVQEGVIAPAPEPSALALVGAGALLLARRRSLGRGK